MTIEKELWKIKEFYADLDNTKQNRKDFADAIIDYMEGIDWGFCPDCDERAGEPVPWTDLD